MKNRGRFDMFKLSFNSHNSRLRREEERPHVKENVPVKPGEGVVGDVDEFGDLGIDPCRLWDLPFKSCHDFKIVLRFSNRVTIFLRRVKGHEYIFA